MALRQKVAPRAVLRITSAVRERLEAFIFSRYPNKEWATFFLFGARETPDSVVITAVDLIEPRDGDLDSTTSIVRFNEPYSLRAALEKQKRELCVGVIHSHPQNYDVFPSAVDDDMDSYFKDYFPAFGKEGTYFSLIFSKTDEGDICFSGRGWNGTREFRLTEMVTVGGNEIRRGVTSITPSPAVRSKNEYQARLE